MMPNKSMSYLLRAVVTLFIASLSTLGWAAAPVLLTTEFLPAQLNQPYTARLYVAATPALSFGSVSGLPPGLVGTLDGFGNVLVTGTPLAAGTFDITIDARNSDGRHNGFLSLRVVSFANTATDISVGTNHTCAVAAGGVQCWGDSTSGQLGVGEAIKSSITPVQTIRVGSGVSQISNGDRNSCAVIEGGVQCWGGGWLGNGTEEKSAYPVQIIPTGSGVASVSIAGGTACAVIRGGVKCWGRNDYGQVGISPRFTAPTSTKSSTAKLTQVAQLPIAVVLSPVDALPAGSGATAVSTALGHSCALVSGGVMCWGNNLFGQLGSDLLENSLAPLWAIPAGSNVVSVSNYGLNISPFTFDGGHTCAALAGGVRCWGENRFGQLGIDTKGGFGLVQTIPAGSGVSAVTSGFGQSCALINGGVECWGQRGGIAGAAYWATTGKTRTPVIPQGSGISIVSGTGSSICALIGGAVRCIGANFGAVQNYETPQTLIAIPTGNRVTEIGGDCAVADGGLRCNNGQKFVDRFPVGSGVTATSLGAPNCVVMNAGVLCADGGNGLSADLYPANAVVTTLDGIRYYVAIAFGSGATMVATPTAFARHSCAVVAGGVQCWGDNSNGQIGNTTRPDLRAGIAIPAGSGATAVAVSSDRTCAVVAGGVKCWGRILTSEAGVSSIPPMLVPTEVMPPGSGVTAIALAESRTCAVANGGVTCWAPRQFGSAGSPTESIFTQPIPTGLGASAISYTWYDLMCAVVRGAVRCLDNPSLEVIPAAANVTTTSGKCAAANGGVICWRQSYDPFDRLSDRRFAELQIAAPPPTINTTTTVFSATQTVRAGATTTFTARVTGSSQPTGTVHFKSDGLTIDGCAASPIVNGEAQCAAVFYPSGTRSVTAEYSGSGSHTRSTGTLNGGQRVIAGEQTIDFSPYDSPDYPFVVHYYVVATASSRLPVKVESLTPATCAVIDDQPNPGTYTVDFYSPGTCTMRATQNGNASFAAAPAVERTVTVPTTLKVHSVVFPAPPATVILGSEPLTHKAEARPMQVTVMSNSPGVCTVSGYYIVLVSVGKCSLTASQRDNAGMAIGTTITRTFDVLSATPTISTDPLALTIDASQVMYADITTLTAKVAGTNPTGSVQFTLPSLIGIPGCNAVPVVNGTARCVVPSDANRLSPPQFRAAYSGDGNNQPTSIIISPTFDFNRARVSIVSDQGGVAPASSMVTVTALVRMRNPVGTVNFTSTTSLLPLAGCSNKSLTQLPGTIDTAIATCAIQAPPTGSLFIQAEYVYPAGHPAIRTNELAGSSIATVTNAPPNYTDMWWAGTRENGWGVSIAQHGAQQFNVIFAYDNAGKPTWYVMPGCTWNAANTACTGALYSPTGAPFAAYDATRFAANAPVGSATFTYKSLSTATLNFTINGVSGTKEIERQLFGAATSEPTLNVNDMWWNGSAENGWGINIAQQGRQLFPVWYTYDANGKPTFYAVSGGTWNGLVFSGDMYSTASSPWLGVAYDASKFIATKVGSMVIDFRDANTATITYTVGTVTQTKMIVRQAF